MIRVLNLMRIIVQNHDTLKEIVDFFECLLPNLQGTLLRIEHVSGDILYEFLLSLAKNFNKLNNEAKDHLFKTLEERETIGYSFFNKYSNMKNISIALLPYFNDLSKKRKRILFMKINAYAKKEAGSCPDFYGDKITMYLIYDIFSNLHKYSEQAINQLIQEKEIRGTRLHAVLLMYKDTLEKVFTYELFSL